MKIPGKLRLYSVWQNKLPSHKGLTHFLLLCRSEDANKAFSQAVQMHDSLVMAWALWGDYLDGLFVLER